MNEKKEALRIEILKYIEKHSRVDLGELAVLLGAGCRRCYMGLSPRSSRGFLGSPPGLCPTKPIPEG